MDAAGEFNALCASPSAVFASAGSLHTVRMAVGQRHGRQRYELHTLLREDTEKCFTD